MFFPFLFFRPPPDASKHCYVGVMISQQVQRGLGTVDWEQRNAGAAEGGHVRKIILRHGNDEVGSEGSRQFFSQFNWNQRGACGQCSTIQTQLIMGPL